MDPQQAQVQQLLDEIPTARDVATQLSLLQRVQEVVFNRDRSQHAHALLHQSLPFLRNLYQHQSAAFVAALLQFLTQAARADAVLLKDLYDLLNSVLMLEYSSEKNMQSALQSAMAHLPTAFRVSCLPTNGAQPATLNGDADAKRVLWEAVQSNVEAHLVFASSHRPRSTPPTLSPLAHHMQGQRGGAGST